MSHHRYNIFVFVFYRLPGTNGRETVKQSRLSDAAMSYNLSSRRSIPRWGRGLGLGGRWNWVWWDNQERGRPSAECKMNVIESGTGELRRYLRDGIFNCIQRTLAFVRDNISWWCVPSPTKLVCVNGTLPLRSHGTWSAYPILRQINVSSFPPLFRHFCKLDILSTELVLKVVWSGVFTSSGRGG